MSFISINPKDNFLVDEIGVDIDTKNELINLFVQINAKTLGKLHFYETKKGYHYRIKLKQKVSLQDAFKLRQYLFDDEYRMRIDAMRVNMGLRIFDVLFTQKREVKGLKRV